MLSLNADVHGCAEDPSVYFADHHNIKCIDIKSFNNTFVNVKTVKTGLDKVGAIDIDRRERMIYWSDLVQYTINRMSLVTGDTEVSSNKAFTVNAREIFSIGRLIDGRRMTALKP